MIGVPDKPLEHIVLSNVSWKTFEKLLNEMGESHYRVTYDEGDLEFMTLSFGHENWGEWIGRLIFFIALECGLPLSSGGSTTLKKSARKKGLEPDKCFWLKHEKEMRGKKEWSTLGDPPPDLAVEIDITRSWLDREGIYAALGVPEIWNFDGSTFRVLVLGANGKYREKSKSLAFPWLPIDGFAQFVTMLGGTDEVSLIRKFTEWLRTHIVPKKDADRGRKNGSNPNIPR